MMMMMMMHIFRKLQLDTFTQCHTITWFYYLISVSLKLCRPLRLFARPSFCYQTSSFYITPPPLLPLSVLFTSSLSLLPYESHYLHSSLTLSQPPPTPDRQSISLFLCCFDSDAVIGLSILILSCQCSAVHSELQLPPPPCLSPPPSTPPHSPLPLWQQKCWWDERAQADSI